MNNSIYEEYMRSVLGYQPINYSNSYEMEYDRFNILQSQELENCYPDIYRIVYPMVQKVCNQNTRAITKDLIESMTDEIYFAIEDKEEKMIESRQPNQNQGLNDLIRILILRELLGRPGFPSGRPPRPPMRPPRPQPR